MSTTGAIARDEAITAGAWTELASRGTGGLEISLLWCRSTGQVKVTVADAACDEEFELEVAGADALDAFHHPFAFTVAPRASTALQLQS